MKKIIVASGNPVKIESTKRAFQKVFPNETFELEGIEVESGVPDQPVGEHETLLGASTRAQNAQLIDGDYWVGIEGGVAEREDQLEAFAWIVILHHGKKSLGRTGSFFLPHKVSELVHQGVELGEADDIVFGQSDSKRKQGSVGLLTHGVLDRTTYYEQALVLALIPFVNEEFYF
ncbi:MAG: inosine/xanthosine triphosphatase [Cyclobacteriaceae bacterium]|nr:inosine/xanthosine triphosphatase [Cyclobacteriaceae bacterium]